MEHTRFLETGNTSIYSSECIPSLMVNESIRLSVIALLSVTMAALFLAPVLGDIGSYKIVPIESLDGKVKIYAPEENSCLFYPMSFFVILENWYTNNTTVSLCLNDTWIGEVHNQSSKKLIVHTVMADFDLKVNNQDNVTLIRVHYFIQLEIPQVPEESKEPVQNWTKPLPTIPPVPTMPLQIVQQLMADLRYKLLLGMLIGTLVTPFPEAVLIKRYKEHKIELVED